MEALTPFAQVPTTPEAIIAQVRRQLTDEARQGSFVDGAALERVADRAVRELWDSPVKTFIPVLALRTAREVLHEQDVVVRLEAQAMRPEPAASSTEASDPAYPPTDVLPVGRDVLSVDEHDVLTV